MVRAVQLHVFLVLGGQQTISFLIHLLYALKSLFEFALSIDALVLKSS